MSEIRFGLFLTNQHPIGSNLVQSTRDQISLVHRVRDLGWDSVWTGQHYLPDGMSMPQCVPFLSRVAAEAGEMHLGIGILLLALHNPLDVAETWASIDAICNGKLIFGVGLGYRESEYRAFGIDPRTKVKRFEENLALIKKLWQGEEVTSNLPWCELKNARISVPPSQIPHPAIWIAANADAAVIRAARLGDAWMINPHANSVTIQKQLELFHSTRESLNLRPVTTIPAMREIYCAPSRAAAMELAQPYLSNKYKLYTEWGQDKALPGNESFNVPFSDLERDRFIIGSPDECLEQLLPWRDKLGVNYFILRTDWMGMPPEVALKSINLLNSEVLPVLRSKSN